jgi:hypothetical protein
MQESSNLNSSSLSSKFYNKDGQPFRCEGKINAKKDFKGIFSPKAQFPKSRYLLFCPSVDKQNLKQSFLMFHQEIRGKKVF